MSERPQGIIIGALLVLIFALYHLGYGAWFIISAGGDPIALLLGSFFALIYIIVGIIALILFIGLWGMKKWAWLWTVIMALLAIIGGVLNIGDIMSIVGLILGVVVLIYMFMPAVRNNLS
ncbi:MAG: hypothetical protein PVI03_08150 [Candidatus Thorarchaeota archaeon]|jgi:hypothetical protein